MRAERIAPTNSWIADSKRRKERIGRARIRSRSTSLVSSAWSRVGLYPVCFIKRRNQPFASRGADSRSPGIAAIVSGNSNRPSSNRFPANDAAPARSQDSNSMQAKTIATENRLPAPTFRASSASRRAARMAQNGCPPRFVRTIAVKDQEASTQLLTFGRGLKKAAPLAKLVLADLRVFTDAHWVRVREDGIESTVLAEQPLQQDWSGFHVALGPQRAAPDAWGPSCLHSRGIDGEKFAGVQQLLSKRALLFRGQRPDVRFEVHKFHDANVVCRKMVEQRRTVGGQQHLPSSGVRGGLEFICQQFQTPG